MKTLFHLLLICSFLILGSVAAAQPRVGGYRTMNAPVEEEEHRENTEVCRNMTGVHQHRPRSAQSPKILLDVFQAKCCHRLMDVRRPSAEHARHSLPNGLTAPLLC